MRGYHEDKKAILARLRRIEGQTRGLQRMVENDEYCIDVLTQIASVRSALDQVALGLVDQHLHHCVVEAMTAQPEEGSRRLDEATLAVKRLLRM
jgi:DNA-binding FrmR family transcriptional regulator